MNNSNKIKEMFQLQNKLNFDTNGDNWVNGITNKGKIINWERAITLELAECIDSFPWKHWKSIEQQPDIQNARIELVDVWHFLMSSIMETQADNLNIKSILNCSDTKAHAIQNKLELFQFNSQEILDITNINFDYISSIFVDFEKNLFDKFSKYYTETWTISEHKDIDLVLSLVEEALLASSLLNRYKVICRDNFTEENFINVLEHTQRLIIAFIAACSSLNLSFLELNKLYIGKNVLNLFRQDNGYKEGTYIKIWNGEEDNIHMIRILDTLDNVTFERVYNSLTAIYNNLDNN